MPAPVPIPDGLRLVAPDAARLGEYLALVDDALAAGETGDGYTLATPGVVRRDSDGYVNRLRELELGINLPDGWVPMSTRWLLDAAGRLVGETRLRHRLSPPLEIEGGHVGYFIARPARRRGYGTAILALALLELRSLGVARVLVTCNEDNARSRRVIERNCGHFDTFTVSPRSGRPVMRFWIENGTNTDLRG